MEKSKEEKEKNQRKVLHRFILKEARITEKKKKTPAALDIV